MPLSLYLLSFIICFEHDVGFRRVWTAAVVFALASVAIYDFFRESLQLGLILELILNFAALFFACMVCHGELARLKPHPRHLTEYDPSIAAGVRASAACSLPSWRRWRFPRILNGRSPSSRRPCWPSGS